MEEGGKWGEAEGERLTKVNLQDKIDMNIDLLIRRGKEYEKMVSDFNSGPSVDRLRQEAGDG